MRPTHQLEEHARADHAPPDQPQSADARVVAPISSLRGRRDEYLSRSSCRSRKRQDDRSPSTESSRRRSNLRAKSHNGRAVFLCESTKPAGQRGIISDRVAVGRGHHGMPKKARRQTVNFVHRFVADLHVHLLPTCRGSTWDR